MTYRSDVICCGKHMSGYVAHEVMFEVDRVWANQRTVGHDRGFRATLTCAACGYQKSTVAKTRDRAKRDVELLVNRERAGV